MNREIDEAIELLRPIQDRCKLNDGWAAGQVLKAIALLESAKGPTGNGWDDVPEVAAMLKDEQAQPPAGEFTTERFRDLGHSMYAAILEACCRLDAKDKTIDRLTASEPIELPIGVLDQIVRQEEEIDGLIAENERLEELCFAYESVHAPVNPLLEENKALTDEKEQLVLDNDALRLEINILAAENARLGEKLEDQAEASDEVISENKAQAERIEKLETFLTDFKDTACREDIALIEQVLEGEEP